MTKQVKNENKAKTKEQLGHDLQCLRREVSESNRLLDEFRTMCKEVSVGLCIFDSEFRFKYINTWLAKINGLPVEAHLGRTVFEVLPSVAEGIESQLRQVTSTGEPIIRRTVEAETPAFPGIKRTFQHSCYLLKSSDNGVTGVCCLVEEISEYKQAEEDLQRSQRRYRVIADVAPVGIFHTDADGDVTFVNDKWCQLGGMTSEAAMGKDWVKAIHPDDRKKVSADWYHASKTTITEFENEYRYVGSDGVTTWCFVRASPELDEVGNTIGFVGALTDITERKMAEAALAKSEARFKDYAETAADYFWEMDADLRYTHFAGRFEEVTGIPPDRALGLTRGEVWSEWVPSPAENAAPFPDLEARRPFVNVEFQWNHPSGGARTLSTSGKPTFDGDGVFLGYRGSCRNITETHALAEKLSYQASHDALTGLMNRPEFERRLQRVLDTAQSEKTAHALCYLDLDQFKVINDTCGHVAGDELLRQLSQLLSANARKRDALARIGGDEFVVLMENCALQQAHRVGDGLRKAVEEFRFVWGKQVFHIGISIGLVPITETSESVANILSAADSACYAAKDEGRNRVHVYHVDDTELARRQGEMAWVARIDQALEDDSFRLWSQPIVPVKGGTGDGEHFELLLRLVGEQGDTVPPGAFLPAAERYGLSTKLDRWVVGTAFDWLSRNPEQLARLHLCYINLSGTSLADEKFSAFVQARLEQSQLPGQKFCFEVTETATIANLSRAIIFMRALKEQGCKFALDDFGSGLSSFAYLKTLPVDYLKIDGAFVKDIVDDDVDLALVRSINAVGKVMGKATIAEFVENEAILDKLREIGVDYAQGYGIGHPAPIEETDFSKALVS